MVVILLSYAGIIFLWDQSLILTVLLVAIVVTLLILRKDIADVWVAVVILVSSAIFEVLNVYLGIWQHANPDYFGVPLWIPAGWVLFALFVRSLYALVDNNSALLKEEI